MVPGSRSMKCAFERTENQGFVCNLAAIPLFGLGPERILLGQRIHPVEEEENRHQIIIGRRFRPISICNVSYKIFPKIIANRIKSIIVKIIFKEPGFMPNQSIFENIIVNEMKDNNNTKKTEIQ
jgi:hypothetical protein